jgi:hypothetical protein
MAVARCNVCTRPSRTKYNYNHAHTTLSTSNLKLLCAEPNCTRPVSIIWLTDQEEQAYLRGERVFRLPSHTGGVQVT